MTAVREALSRDEWLRLIAETSPPLLALWADTREVYALLQGEAAPRLVSTAVEDGSYPALSPVRPVAAYFERMVRDLWGHTAAGGIDQRPWLDHGRWQTGAPMALRPGPGAPAEAPEFPASEGFDQLLLGPVHGGIHAPAHLHVALRGERIARLEARLGYAHKGALALVRGKSPRAAARFAARLAGEATVAHSIAFARATEAASECDVPPRAAAWRDIMAELERITCHLDSLATLAEIAGIVTLSPWCARHAEGLRKVLNIAFGHRLMMDCVIPGGLSADIPPGGAEAINRALSPLAAELPDLMRLPLARNLAGIGVVTPAHAALFAGAGLVGHPGDAGTRARARLAQISDSVRLVRNRLGGVPDGVVSVPLPTASGEALGFAEGPRGEIWHWLRLDHGQIASAFMRDPAWVHWPLLEAVMTGGESDGLALVMASFGLAVSGADL